MHRFFCPEKGCFRGFDRASDQKRHILQQHKGKSQMCTLCQRTYKRPYVHKTCQGRQSVFHPAQWQPNKRYGCGLCVSYFSDFDKWVRHIQAHQEEGKEKGDWDLSLELQSLLSNPDLSTALAFDYSSVSIDSMTWLEENYHEAKDILETIDHNSLDQLQRVFDLATPLWNLFSDFPIPNYLTISADSEARDNISLAMRQEAEAIDDNPLPAHPGNFGWYRGDMVASGQDLTRPTLTQLHNSIVYDHPPNSTGPCVEPEPYVVRIQDAENSYFEEAKVEPEPYVARIQDAEDSLFEEAKVERISVGLPSDSGYASIEKGFKVGDHTKTSENGSIMTDNEAITIEPQTKTHLISTFAREIRQSLQEIFEIYPESIDSVIVALPELLKAFSIELKGQARSDLQRDTTTFVRHYRE